MTSFSRAFRYRCHTKGILSARRAAKKDVYAVVPRLNPRDVI